MSSIIAVFETARSTVRSLHSFFRAGCERGTETVDQQPEMDSDPSQPKNKRKKVQTLLCVNSKYINRITDWLGSDDITVIGIHGMGGIGKTTLAMHIYDQLRSNDISSSNFHAIGWVSVELEFTVYQLQKQIATAFGIDLKGDTDKVRRASRLHAYLSRTNKKFTLFLDDLWSDFRCEDVGIPRNCKLVVVSRLLDVCRVLRCQKIIKVEPLTEEESWELLHYNIGGYSVSDSEKVSSLKRMVYDESAGLPLAVTVLANSVAEMVDDASQWTELSIGPTLIVDMLNRLKLSYDLLNIKLQRCFLYCASYPKGYAINKEELIHIWIREGLIDDGPPLQAQLDMGHAILNKLLNSCLLEACDNTDSIKMHDLVRRMALFITRDCSKVKADLRSKLEYFNITDTIKSLSTSFGEQICQPLATMSSS